MIEAQSKPLSIKQISTVSLLQQGFNLLDKVRALDKQNPTDFRMRSGLNQSLAAIADILIDRRDIGQALDTVAQTAESTDQEYYQRLESIIRGNY